MGPGMARRAPPLRPGTVNICTRMHPYGHIRAHMYTYGIRTRMHTYAHIRAHMHTYAPICTYTHTYAHIRIHMRAYAHTYAHMRIYAQICSQMHTCAHICTQYARICTHMRTYAHISARKLVCWFLWPEAGLCAQRKQPCRRAVERQATTRGVRSAQTLDKTAVYQPPPLVTPAHRPSTGPTHSVAI